MNLDFGRNDESTKTRIETDSDASNASPFCNVVMTNPLKQGLKLYVRNAAIWHVTCRNDESTKTRIETIYSASLG